MGLRPNLDTNQIVIKSKKPLMKRSAPNFVEPYFLAWCCTTFSVMSKKPAFLAKTGIYRCISPETSMVFTTLWLKALSPQLKSCNFTPEVFRAAQLNNLEGMFLVITE